MSERCELCGREVAIGSWPWCPHGTPNLVIADDSIPGGMTVENMGHEPLTFHSKGEWRRAMKERGLTNMVRHVPTQGSDKSRFTQRFL